LLGAEVDLGMCFFEKNRCRSDPGSGEAVIDTAIEKNRHTERTVLGILVLLFVVGLGLMVYAAVIQRWALLVPGGFLQIVPILHEAGWDSIPLTQASSPRPVDLARFRHAYENLLNHEHFDILQAIFGE